MTIDAGADPGRTRILDLGYRSYVGRRTGVPGAVRSLVRVTLQRALGIHRPARSKVFPVLAIVIAYLPTMVYIGVTVLGNRLDDQGAPGSALAGQFVPSYASHYPQVVLAVIIIAAFVAPEVMCPDRRTGMLGVYLSSALNRTTYLVAKGLAVLIMVSTVSVGPPLLLLIGYSTQGYGPDGPVQWLATLGRVLFAGLVISLLYSCVSLAVSSVTTRKAVASAGFAGLLIGFSGLAGFLVVGAGESINFGVLNLFSLPYDAVFRIFSEPTEFAYNGGIISTPLLVAGYLAWVAVSLAVIVGRYWRLEVAR